MWLTKTPHTYTNTQTVMTEYIHTEMVFHAKALEVFTQAHQNIQNINEEEVIEVL